MGGRLFILKLVRKILKKIITYTGKCSYDPAAGHVLYDNDDNDDDVMSVPPEDVKKGHFVVHTVDGGESRRFVVELSYLTHPGFLRLLELAEEEFGFRQTGVLAIPCRGCDLQSVLQSKE